MLRTRTLLPRSDRLALRRGGATPTLALLVTGFIGVAVLWRFLVGSKLLLFLDLGSDTYLSYYPFYYLLVDHVSQLRLPMWSFQLGMGTSIVTLYQFLYDPFSLLYYLIGTERLAEALVWVYLLKILCCAWFTYLYARYLDLEPQVRVIASVLYAFNGFLMVWGQHFFFASWTIFLPLLLLAIERFFREGRWGLLCLVCGGLATSIAIFYQVVIFCAFYVLFRCLWDASLHQRDARFGKLPALAGVVALGVALTALLWLPQYHLLSTSPRISASFFARLQEWGARAFEQGPPAYYISALNRLFSNNLEGVGSVFKGFFNYYEAIALYGGLLPLLVLPQAFVVLPRRAWWVLALGMLCVAAAVAFPMTGMLMNGLQFGSWRWGYGLILFMVLLAALTLHAMAVQRRVHVPLLVLTTLVLIATLVLLCRTGKTSFGAYARVMLLLAVLGAVLVWWVRAERRARPFAVLLLCLCVVQFLEHDPSFRKRALVPKQLERSASYFDGAFKAAQALRHQDTSFYRTDKNPWAVGPNASAIQGYRGLDAYNSLNTPAYFELVRHFELAQIPLLIQWHSLQRPHLADIASVKYHLTKDPTRLPIGAKWLARYDDVDVYERTSALPFGFVYDTYLPQALLAQLPLADQERAMLHAAIVEPDAQGQLQALDALPPTGADASARQARRAQTVQWTLLQDDHLAGRIALERGGLLFLSIPFERGWSATVDGRAWPLVRTNIGFSGLHLPAGAHALELSYAPPYWRAGLLISLLSLSTMGVLAVYQRRRNIRVEETK